jgi:hypothetical protein
MAKKMGATHFVIATDPGRRGVEQRDKISHIDMRDDHIDTVIFRIISPYPISISRMTVSIW